MTLRSPRKPTMAFGGFFARVLSRLPSEPCDYYKEAKIMQVLKTGTFVRLTHSTKFEL